MEKETRKSPDALKYPSGLLVLECWGRDPEEPIIDWLLARMRDIEGLVYVSAGFMITLAALFYIYGGEEGKRWAKSMIRASIASVFIVKMAPLLIETF